MTAPIITEKKFIGNGRSAKVYFSYHAGKGIATKTFTGEPVSKLILFILTGSANPYTWCEDAIESAMIRRRMLRHLCKFWFNDNLRLPQTYQYRWNATEKAYEIDAEFISGSHAPLLNPMHQTPVDYMAILKKEVMKPLQEKLIASGFDGLVWQAGKGNPVGASNFMIRFNEDGTYQWIWIDLESGLPALFAMNPLATLFYYLPKCVKHKDWLFDNVDVLKLENYLTTNKAAIQEKLGQQIYDQLWSDCKKLATSQKAWKSLSRHQKSLNYAFSQDKVSAEEKSFYEHRPLRWFAKNLILFLTSFISSFQEKVKKAIDRILEFKFKKLFRRIYFYFTDSFYRWGVIRWFLKWEIDKWHSRGFLSKSERQTLHSELRNDEISAYITDFSIHMGIKPFVKSFEWIVVPILTATGFLSIGAAAMLILWTGPLMRTIYTLWRMSHSLVKSRAHFPFVALLVGALPIIGNLAYPLELLYQSTGKRNLLGRFMTYSFSAKVGAKIPIWGGKDSEIEHFFNNICHRIIGVPFQEKRPEAEPDSDNITIGLRSAGIIKTQEMAKKQTR